VAAGSGDTTDRVTAVGVDGAETAVRVVDAADVVE
jgi:hypothetical protein